MKSPLISIITVVFNGATTIQNCLVSVCAQSVTSEQVIIDANSTDNTLEIVNKVAPQAKVLSEPDKGIYDAMNKGISLATGEIIGILNADDFYDNEFVLEKVLEVFKNPNIDACYGDLVYIRNNSNSAFISFGEIVNECDVHRNWKAGNYSDWKFYWGWMPPHPTFFIRKCFYVRYGLYNLNLGSSADYELMLRMLFKYKLIAAYIPETLVIMRSGGISNKSLLNRIRANKMDRLAWKINLLSPYPWTLIMKPVCKLGQFRFWPMTLLKKKVVHFFRTRAKRK